MRVRDTIVSAATFLLLYSMTTATPVNLRTFLESPGGKDADARSRASAALGRTGDARRVEALVQALVGDPDPHVREHAASALGEIGDPCAMVALEGALLNDPDDLVREHAAAALTSLCPIREKVNGGCRDRGPRTERRNPFR